MIFVLSGSSNFSNYFKHESAKKAKGKDKSDGTFAFDFQLVGKASFFIYFCGFMTPIAITRHLQKDLKRTHVADIGYVFESSLVQTEERTINVKTDETSVLWYCFANKLKNVGRALRLFPRPD